MFQNFLSKVRYLSNFTFDENETAYTTGVWKVYDGVRKADNSKCSIFIALDEHKTLAQNAVQALKTLRHPYIIKVLEVEPKCQATGRVYLVTERVRPFAARDASNKSAHVWS
ncbi:unnamed protein product, partial [Amoebophrya sp. A25]|eukprot:GSA25T00016941001.1